MAKKDLRLEPHLIREKDCIDMAKEDVWWYEDSKGICVILSNYKGGGQFFIRWSVIKKAIERLEFMGRAKNGGRR